MSTGKQTANVQSELELRPEPPRPIAECRTPRDPGGWFVVLGRPGESLEELAAYVRKRFDWDFRSRER